MRKRRTHIASLFVGLISAAATAATSTVGTVSAPADAKYVEPKAALLEANAKALQLPPDERRRIAAGLVAWLCKAPARTQTFFDQATRVLAVALVLDPESRSAVITNIRLRSGELPEVAPAPPQPPLLAATLRRNSSTLLQPFSRDCTRMAGYLLMLAAEVTPKNDEILYDLEMFKKKGLDLTWDVLFEARTAAATATIAAKPANSRIFARGTIPEFARRAKPFARSQSSVKALFVSEIPGAGRTGKVMDIIATVFANNEPDKTTIRFARPIGSEMSVSWDEAMRVSETRYPHWEPGTVVSLSFSDKYSQKDGGSAGVAFCMLFWSLLDGVELDQQCAVTGDVTIDWKVRPIGGVDAKIRGATLDKCRYVLIPKANQRQIEDAILLNSISILWGIQVLTIDELTEAAAMMRADKDAQTTEALEIFAGLQAKARTAGAPFFRTPEAQQSLRAVLQKLPNHASAQMILRALTNDLPAKLTLAASVEEAMTSMVPALPFLVRAEGSRGGGVLLGTGDSLTSARRRLERLRPLTDPKGKAFHQASLQCLLAAEDYQQTAAKVNAPGRKVDASGFQLVHTKESALRTAGESFLTALRALQTDKSVMEILQRQ